MTKKLYEHLHQRSNPNETGERLRDPVFKVGMHEMATVGLGIGAWGVMTGLAMVKSGIGIIPVVMTTIFVFAGSLQLAALPLLAAGFPAWLVLAHGWCRRSSRPA